MLGIGGRTGVNIVVAVVLETSGMYRSAGGRARQTLSVYREEKLYAKLCARLNHLQEDCSLAAKRALISELEQQWRSRPTWQMVDLADRHETA